MINRLDKLSVNMVINKKLKLHIPMFDELWYRQKLIQDVKTMSYNKGYDISFEGDHKDTGCIDFPKESWQEWFEYFINKEPERFYAYIVRLEDDTFIGEVNIHKSHGEPWHEMGIVLEAKYRCQGYATEALNLLLTHAFNKLNITAIHNSFEEMRTAAVYTHLSAGFTEYHRENGLLEVLITKVQWIQKNAELGNADCQYQLAMMYIYGNDVPEDNTLAFNLLKKASAQNHIEATYNLAICYHYGHGTEIDLKTAFQLYLNCANAGYGKGMVLIGRFYNRGIYVSRDCKKAEYWLNKALQSDDVDAVNKARIEFEYTDFV